LIQLSFETNSVGQKVMVKTAFLAAWFAGLILGAASVAAAQTSASLEVGVAEKLGAEVALDAVLKDEQGREVTLRSLIDRPTILTLNYFRCSGICTPLLNGVADVINQIQLEPGKDFQVITVSFDPTDTPDIARQKQIGYLKLMQRPMHPSSWRFLTGEERYSRQVADSVGFNFRSVKDQYLHPGAIIILTPKGIVSHYLYGIAFLPAEVQMSIRDAASEQVRPTISKILAFCYNYDPDSRRYVLNITRLAGGAILVFGAGFVVFLLRGRVRSGKDAKERSE
jgi:protein SCO1/2